MNFQLGASLLDACVLAVLSNGSTYGYSLTQKIKEIINISDSTLYTVLRRLQKENYLETYDEAFEGRNRRYYEITSSGLNKLDEYKSEWKTFKNSIEKILHGGFINE